MKKMIMAVAVIGFSLAMTMTAWAGTWKQDNNGWWYENDNGTYQNDGWFQDPADGQWYFASNSGYILQNTWMGNYYLGASGAMLTNTTTPDGYKVGADGAWIPNTNKLSYDNTLTQYFNLSVVQMDRILGAEKDVYVGEGDYNAYQKYPNVVFWYLWNTDADSSMDLIQAPFNELFKCNGQQSVSFKQIQDDLGVTIYKYDWWGYPRYSFNYQSHHYYFDLTNENDFPTSTIINVDVDEVDPSYKYSYMGDPIRF